MHPYIFFKIKPKFKMKKKVKVTPKLLQLDFKMKY